MNAPNSNGWNVPFADLHAQYRAIRGEIDGAIADVIAKSAFIRGPKVDAFESEFAAMVEQSHCVSCANGTDALYIAMKALGLKPGDEVIVPAMSWISTSETVTQAGGTVVFCDIDPQTYTMDPASLETVITDRTVGVIPVHLYGQPCDMTAIMAIADDRNLWVLEDCAQAHLARFENVQVGGFGVAATYSFYPGKNLGAMGDAGAIVTADEAMARQMAMFSRHGGLRKGDHEIEGINSRLDGLQAAILSVKLKHLQNWTERRREIAAIYLELLNGTPGIVLPHVADGREAVWHLFVVRTERRDDLQNYLKALGIQCQINYPRALPFLPCYADIGAKAEDYPIAHALGEQCLSLPIFPEMDEAQIDAVVSGIQSYARKADAAPA